MCVFVPPLVLLVMVWGCYRGWQRLAGRRAALWVAGSLLVTGLGDGLLLAGLPRLGLSFGPLDGPWFLFVVVRGGLAGGPLVLRRAAHDARLLGTAAFVCGLNLALSAGAAYGMYFEPFNLGLTRVDMALPAADSSLTIRAVHLTDLHVERITRRERAMLDIVEQLEADVIFLTGDYLSTAYLDDETARQDVRSILRQLHAPYGVYAVGGNVDRPAGLLAALFEDMDHITLLEDELVAWQVGGQTIYLLGVSDLDRTLERGRDRDSLRALMERVPAGAPTILLYHNPDLIETAAELGVDVYLAGHTHGGQVRLPLYGAIFTSSAYHKRYEAGLYRLGPTQLYVSRGVGLEGLFGAPRVRFLCPPEIVEITLRGEP